MPTLDDLDPALVLKGAESVQRGLEEAAAEWRRAEWQRAQLAALNSEKPEPTDADVS